MSKRKLIFAVSVLTVLSLAACGKGGSGKMTADSILKQAAENTTDLKSMEADCKTVIAMDYDLTQLLESEDQENLEEGESTYSLTCEMDMDMQIIAEPMSLFLDAVTKMNNDGSESQYAYQTYGVTTEDGTKMNIYSGVDEDWYMKSVNLEDYSSMEEDLAMASNLAKTKDAAYELAKSTEKLGDREVYVLNGRITGDTLQSIAEAASTISDMLGTKFDLENSVATIVYKVYTDNLMPASVEIDLTGVLNEALNTAGISVTESTVSYTFLSFNSISEISVPDSVLEKATEMEFGSEDLTEVEDTLVDTTDKTVEGIVSTLEKPAAAGEWVSAYARTEAGDCDQVFIKVNGVSYGDEDGKIEAQYKTWYGNSFVENTADQEYMAIDYDIYVPSDFDGTVFRGINLFAVNADGSFYDYDYGYIEVLDYDAVQVKPGQTAHVTGMYVTDQSHPAMLMKMGDASGNETFITLQ